MTDVAELQRLAALEPDPLRKRVYYEQISQTESALAKAAAEKPADAPVTKRGGSWSPSRKAQNMPRWELEQFKDDLQTVFNKLSHAGGELSDLLNQLGDRNAQAYISEQIDAVLGGGSMMSGNQTLEEYIEAMDKYIQEMPEESDEDDESDEDMEDREQREADGEDPPDGTGRDYSEAGSPEEDELEGKAAPARLRKRRPLRKAGDSDDMGLANLASRVAKAARVPTIPEYVEALGDASMDLVPDEKSQEFGKQLVRSFTNKAQEVFGNEPAKKPFDADEYGNADQSA